MPDRTPTRGPDGAGRPAAIILLSGGLDSATCLALAIAEGRHCCALSVRYGQRHEAELGAARRLAASAGVEHVVLDVDLRAIGGSALTSDDEIPRASSVEAVGQEGIPATYVPARNTILLSLAIALAEVRGASEVFIGVNALDYSGYPDCRPAFIESFERTANLATRAATQDGAELRVRAPLIERSKAQIISLAHDLGVDLAATVSCYDPRSDVACGTCDACLLRRRGFEEAGLADPAPHAVEVRP